VLVLASFHFVNRMADLLQVDAEVPGLSWLRRVEPLRRGIVRVMSVVLGRMDLASRSSGFRRPSTPCHRSDAALRGRRAAW